MSLPSVTMNQETEDLLQKLGLKFDARTFRNLFSYDKDDICGNGKQEDPRPCNRNYVGYYKGDTFFYADIPFPFPVHDYRFQYNSTGIDQNTKDDGEYTVGDSKTLSFYLTNHLLEIILEGEVIKVSVKSFGEYPELRPGLKIIFGQEITSINDIEQDIYINKLPPNVKQSDIKAIEINADYFLLLTMTGDLYFKLYDHDGYTRLFLPFKVDQICLLPNSFSSMKIEREMLVYLVNGTLYHSKIIRSRKQHHGLDNVADSFLATFKYKDEMDYDCFIALFKPFKLGKFLLDGRVVGVSEIKNRHCFLYLFDEYGYLRVPKIFGCQSELIPENEQGNKVLLESPILTEILSHGAANISMNDFTNMLRKYFRTKKHGKELVPRGEPITKLTFTGSRDCDATYKIYLSGSDGGLYYFVEPYPGDEYKIEIVGPVVEDVTLKPNPKIKSSLSI